MDRWIHENINREICQIANSRNFSDAKISQYTVLFYDSKVKLNCLLVLMVVDLDYYLTQETSVLCSLIVNIYK